MKLKRKSMRKWKRILLFISNFMSLFIKSNEENELLSSIIFLLYLNVSKLSNWVRVPAFIYTWELFTIFYWNSVHRIVWWTYVDRVRRWEGFVKKWLTDREFDSTINNGDYGDFLHNISKSSEFFTLIHNLIFVLKEIVSLQHNTIWKRSENAGKPYCESQLHWYVWNDQLFPGFCKCIIFFVVEGENIGLDHIADWWRKYWCLCNGK